MACNLDCKRNSEKCYIRGDCNFCCIDHFDAVVFYGKQYNGKTVSSIKINVFCAKEKSRWKKVNGKKSMEKSQCTDEKWQ